MCCNSWPLFPAKTDSFSLSKSELKAIVNSNFNSFIYLCFLFVNYLPSLIYSISICTFLPTIALAAQIQALIFSLRGITATQLTGKPKYGTLQLDIRQGQHQSFSTWPVGFPFNVASAHLSSLCFKHSMRHFMIHQLLISYLYYSTKHWLLLFPLPKGSLF